MGGGLTFERLIFEISQQYSLTCHPFESSSLIFMFRFDQWHLHCLEDLSRNFRHNQFRISYLVNHTKLLLPNAVFLFNKTFPFYYQSEHSMYQGTTTPFQAFQCLPPFSWNSPLRSPDLLQCLQDGEQGNGGKTFPRKWEASILDVTRKAYFKE